MFISKYSIRSIFLCTLLVLSFSTIVNANESPAISAEGAVLIDVESGRILFEINSDKQMRIASLTKIMTSIVAIESGDLNDIVTTSDRAFGVEGSSIYLKKGEKLSLENMIYGLMLRSGNDAAVAIAEHVGGSLEGFVYLMNEKAMYLGLENTHFMNPHGLDHDEHYSTPEDMAKLTAYALQNPKFQEIVSTKVRTAPLEGEKWDRKWLNKNKLLYRYQYADGVKTGYTKISKRCLASSATKNGHQLAIITLNAPDDWNDHIKLFEYGFNTYEHIELVKAGEIIASEKGYDVIASNTFTFPLKETEKELITKEIDYSLSKKKGTIKLYFDQEYIGSIPLEIKKINK